jgi:ferrous iron transport protein A
MATLDQLKAGDHAVVEAVGGEPALVQRLLEFGLLEGEEIEVLALAPLGDPIEIRCRDSRLSLRRREAAGIRVLPRPAS